LARARYPRNVKEVNPAPPPIVQNQFESVKELFGRYVVPSYARFDLAFARGQGSYVWDVAGRRYQDQAKFFLNAFWPEIGADKAESVWNFWKKFIELDKLQYGALAEGKKPEVCSEGSSLDEFWSHKFLESWSKTLTAVAFREEFKKIDVNFDKRMAMVEFLLYEHKQTVAELLKRPQGVNEELLKAQAALDEVNKEVEAIEKKKSELNAKAEKGGVSGKTAKQELEQLLAADPLELNRAIVTAEAQLRKAQKLTGEQPQGQLWWIGREIAEAKKYKPQKK